tara:strand:+ start:936 stop:1139 length:204 start_codon:yes stop_codon:yes gene_type:complete
MSNLVNDTAKNMIADDVFAIYDNGGVWAVIKTITDLFGADKVLYSKDDDDHIDTLIYLMCKSTGVVA